MCLMVKHQLAAEPAAQPVGAVAWAAEAGVEVARYGLAQRHQQGPAFEHCEAAVVPVAGEVPSGQLRTVEAIGVAHVLTVAPLVLRHRASREIASQRTQTPPASQAGANASTAAQSAPSTQAQTRTEPAEGKRSSDAVPQPSGAQSARESAPPGGDGADQAKATPGGEPGLTADRGSLAPNLAVASQAVAESHAEALALEAMEAIAAKKARASSTRR